MTDPLAAVRMVAHGEVMIATLEGEVDLSNARDVREQILAGIPNAATGLVIDLSKTTYLDSRGIQALLEITERLRVRQQRIRLMVPMGTLIRRVLGLASVTSSVPLDATIGEALTRLQAGEAEESPRD